MIPHRAEFLELCAGHALGTLSDTDRRELDSHLSGGCAWCEAELTSLSTSVELLAASVPQRRAPAQLRARVLGDVRAEMAAARAALPPLAPNALPLRPRRSRAVWGWALAASLLAVTAGLEWRANAQLRARLAADQAERTHIEQQLADERSWANLLAKPGVIHVALAPTKDGAAELLAHVTYDPATRRALIVCEHFIAPSGRDYQLWAIGSNGAASLGLVHADAQGRAVIRLSDAADPDGLGAFAVSLEQAGGAPTATAPAGPVVMVGKVGG